MNSASQGALTDRSTIVVGRFAPVIERGLLDVLNEDHQLRVLASGLGQDALEGALPVCGPAVVIIDEPAERSALERLGSAGRTTGIVVFVHEPRRWDAVPSVRCHVRSSERFCR